MPRATKEIKKDELKEKKETKKSTSSAKKVTSKATKKSAPKKSTATVKKDSAITKKTKSTSAARSKKVASKKGKTTTKAKVSAKNVAEKKETKNKKSSTKVKKESKTSKTTSSKKPTKKTTSKDAVTPKKTKTTTTKKRATTTKREDTKTLASTRKKNTSTKSKKVEKNIVAEYYDLPYRYNETIVKILYQAPNVLFVYWDISDDDRNHFVNQYGENFFNDTKPILKIFNLTKNYNFEIEINDFANSWYINVNDANCDYKVELGRKPISYDNNINTDYIYVSSSNNIVFPNDHILLEELPDIVNFKNVKTNRISTKNISTLRLVGINKIYSVYDFYKKLYNNNILDELDNKKILNPSSTSSWSN